MAYHIEWTNNFVQITFSNDVSKKEVFEAGVAINGDHRFDSMRFQFIDLLDVHSFNFDKQSAQKAAAIGAAASTWQGQAHLNTKVAIITDNDFIKTMAKEYRDILTENSNWQCRIFSSFGLAKKWISTV